MSHLKERKERNCLNCNAIVHGKYCHICGQENIEPKESFGHLISHFFQDITHFDGKFFSTIKYLLLRPGYLSREYMVGRRASHVNPIRLYIFASAFFFLIFFTFYESNFGSVKVNNSSVDLMEQLNRNKTSLLLKLQKELNKPDHEEEVSKLKKIITETEADISLLQKDTTAVDKLQTIRYNFNAISFDSGDTSRNYKTVHEYDSVQKSLPKSERDGFIKKRLERQNLYLKEKYHNDGRAILRSIGNNFLHRFPQLLFVSLPLFSFILWLLYVRRRKEFYYVNHIIYSIHLYCASFIIILFGLWLSSILGWFGTKIPLWLNLLFTLGTFFYIYKAQRNFYGQRRGKTILKFILLFIATLFLLLLLFAVFFIFSTFTA